MLDLFLRQLHKQILKSICLELRRRQSVVLRYLVNKSPELSSHEETLHERVHIASIAQILQSTIPETDLALLPILLLLLVRQLPNSQLIKLLMNNRSLNGSIISFLDLPEKPLGSLTQIRKTILIQCVKLNYLLIDQRKIRSTMNQMQTQIVCQLVNLLALKTLSIAQTHHEKFSQF